MTDKKLKTYEKPDIVFIDLDKESVIGSKEMVDRFQPKIQEIKTEFSLGSFENVEYQE